VAFSLFRTEYRIPALKRERENQQSGAENNEDGEKKPDPAWYLIPDLVSFIDLSDQIFDGTVFRTIYTFETVSFV